MEALYADVIGYSDFETKEKKRKIRSVKVVSTGHFFHVIEGNVKSVVYDNEGIRTVNMLVKGYRLPKLRKIRDFVNIDIKTGKNVRLVCIPILVNRGGLINWYYETSPKQDLENILDWEKELFEATVKDFSLRDWEKGPQLIPVTFNAYLSKSGNKGIDYIASDDSFQDSHDKGAFNPNIATNLKKAS